MKFPKGMLRFAASCALLGSLLTAAGFVMGGRFTAIHVYWDNGPRVEYRDWRDTDAAFSEGPVTEAVDRGTAGEYALSEPESVDLMDDVSDMVSEDSQRPGGGHYAIPTGDIQKLKVDAGACEVVITPGDDWGVWSAGGVKFTSEIDGDEWEIETTGKGGSGLGDAAMSLHITVPEDAFFAELDLSIGAGMLYAEHIGCEAGEFKVGAGEMTLNEVACLTESDFEVGAGVLSFAGQLWGEADIDCGAGSVIIETLEPDSYDYELDCALGSVVIDDQQYSGVVVKKKRNEFDADLIFDIDCGLGSVQVTFE